MQTFNDDDEEIIFYDMSISTYVKGYVYDYKHAPPPPYFASFHQSLSIK